MSQKVEANTDCLTCANCCKTSPPLMQEEDVKRISKYLGISKKQFSRKYLIEDINGDKSMRNIPCAFLESDNACSIYEIRPLSCRGFPHLDEKGFYKLRKLHSRNVMKCPIAFKVVDKLRKIEN